MNSLAPALNLGETRGRLRIAAHRLNDYSGSDAVNEVVFRPKDLGDFDDEGTIKADIGLMIKRLTDS